MKKTANAGGVTVPATKSANSLECNLPIHYPPRGLRQRCLTFHQGRDLVNLSRLRKGRHRWVFELTVNEETDEISDYRKAMCTFLSNALYCFVGEHFEAWEDLFEEEKAFGKTRDGNDPDDAYFEAIRSKLQHLAWDLRVRGEARDQT